jgi:phage portal protein BeeE
VSLVDRVNAGAVALRRGPRGSRDFSLSPDGYAELLTFAGNTYPVVQTTMGTVDQESVGAVPLDALRRNAPVAALVLARLQAFSQTRFRWTRFDGTQPGDLFGSPELSVLERPWPNGTTSDLLARMEIHVSGAGNAYVARPRRDRLSVLRPDRVTIVMASATDADDPAEAPDVEVAGYIHETSRGKLTFFTPAQVAHYAPYPDPDAVFLGMSWITPVIREMQGDSLATEHKARFFANSATPNLAIKFDASVTIERVREFKELLEAEHRGAWNAWKTLYLGGGADTVPVGSSFKDMDYAAIQGKAESRLAAAAGVPPSWVGFSEGLQGSALNAGNFNSARRRFSDGTMYHLWTNAASSLETLLSRPPDVATAAPAMLWFDTRVPFMREDAQDRSAIAQQEAQTIAALVREGFTPESAVDAVLHGDWTRLKHTGWYSVQMQPPNTAPAASVNGKTLNGVSG